jgi:3'-phosphoadenosine 5'-phosphosulfate sulfotransferase (PAPS reductase)/FAD synthetase
MTSYAWRGDMSIKIVVPISGGKDSQACAKLAVQKFGSESVVGLFNDTGWEHPLTYAHIDKIRDLYDIEIVQTIGSVKDEILKLKRFPNAFARFCTDRLKIVKSRDFYTSLSAEIVGFEVWIGIRADESVKRSKRYAGIVCDETYAPHDINASYPKYLEKRGVTFRFPIIEWTTEDVFKFLDGQHNPLYNAGHKRVGCFPCLASSSAKHQECFELDDFGASQKQRVIALEKAIGRKHAPANTDQICMFCHI